MKIRKVIHKLEERIVVDIPYSTDYLNRIKEISGARWSKTMHSWHIPYTIEAFKQLKTVFKDTIIDVEAKTEAALEEVPVIVLPTPELNEKKIKPRCDIEVYQLNRKILVKMPKNDLDIQFLNTFRFNRWNSKDFVWELPNYKGNLDKIEAYFKERIKVLSRSDILTTSPGGQVIKTNEVLCIKTTAGRIKIIGMFNLELNKVINKIPYHTWDSENKWWSIPFTERFLNDIKQCIIQQNLEFLYEEEISDQSKTPRLHPENVVNYKPCPDECLHKLTELRYSANTQRLYKTSFEEFINFYPKYDIKRIDEPMIIAFVRYLVTERKVSVSYQNVSINAIKFYYERVLGGQRKIYRIERPIKGKTLPVVLSESEVSKIFKQIANIKHKALLMLIYSAGLRISEAIHMKITDIDSKRNQVFVRCSKGKKDRYTLLSKKMIVTLRDYYTTYKPEQWLFEGKAGEQYSESSIQAIIKHAVNKAGITKKVTAHTFRHSFATHLLESGTDLRYIQSILGHESSKTTEIYTHVTSKGFDQIRNPLDELEM